MERRNVLLTTGIISVVIIMFILVLVNLLGIGPSSYYEGQNSASSSLMASTTGTPATTPTTEALATSGSAASIYFGTDDDGIYVYSEETGSVNHFRSTKEDVEGVAYDPRWSTLYYSTHTAIHRVGMDGTTGDQIVLPLNQTLYGSNVWGLAIDWITGNLYGASTTGYVFTCKTAPAVVTLSCKSIRTGQGSLYGLALNPNLGTMYWTKGSSLIVKADMDGANDAVIVRGSVCNGIAIDYVTSRLYWGDGSRGIKSSDAEGGDVRLIVPLSKMPWGLTVSSRRIYWGYYSSGNSVQSSTKEGQDLKTIFNGKEEIQHMTVVEGSLPVTRRNDCDGQVCSGICVLTPTSFRCLS